MSLRSGRNTVVMLLILAATVATMLLSACGNDTTTTTAPEESTTTAAPTTSGSVSTDTTTAATGGTLEVRGLVENPVVLTAADVSGMTVETISAEHPKKGMQEYTGVRMSALFEQVKPKAEATTMVMAASDGYMAEVPLADVKANADTMLALGDDGSLNAVMPGFDGQAWVKNVVTIEFK